MREKKERKEEKYLGKIWKALKLLKPSLEGG